MDKVSSDFICVFCCIKRIDCFVKTFSKVYHTTPQHYHLTHPVIFSHPPTPHKKRGRFTFVDWVLLLPREDHPWHRWPRVESARNQQVPWHIQVPILAAGRVDGSCHRRFTSDDWWTTAVCPLLSEERILGIVGWEGIRKVSNTWRISHSCDTEILKFP